MPWRTPGQTFDASGAVNAGHHGAYLRAPTALLRCDGMFAALQPRALLHRVTLKVAACPRHSPAAKAVPRRRRCCERATLTMLTAALGPDTFLDSSPLSPALTVRPLRCAFSLPHTTSRSLRPTVRSKSQTASIISEDHALDRSRRVGYNRHDGMRALPPLALPADRSDQPELWPPALSHGLRHALARLRGRYTSCCTLTDGGARL